MKLINSTTLTRLSMIALLVISLTLLQACGILSQQSGQASSGKQGRVITVTSDPSGATIRANGNMLGETPLVVDIEKSFPRHWTTAEDYGTEDYGVSFRMKGVLTIEKIGCSDYTVPVSETEPSDDVSITLVCTDIEEQTTRSSVPVQSITPDSMKQRLKKLEKLHRDGTISTQEYNQHRSRILGEL